MGKQDPFHFKIWVDDCYLNDEGYTLHLVVRKDSKRKMISTGFFVYPHQWDSFAECMVVDNRVKNLHPQRKEINDWLIEKKAELKCLLNDFEDKKLIWTPQQFVDTFVEKIKVSSVFDYFQSMIRTLEEEKHWGLRNQYYWTCHVMELADKTFLKRIWSEIDYTYVVAFDHYLKVNGKKGEGCSGNTRVYYLKGLRAIYNKAIKAGCATSTVYPFGKDGFSISKLEEDTPKRYIKSKDFGKIKEEVAVNEYREKVRKIFLFCYQCYGMAIRDAALLKRKVNIISLEEGDFISYKRIKTKNNRKVKPIFIKINDKIRELLEWFKENTTLVDDYLLPIISIGYEAESEKLYNHITYRNRRINELLKGIAKDLAIDMNITTHVNRHTAANRLQDMGIPRDIIQEMFGHMDPYTTTTYLDSFSHEVVAKAGNVL